jgi:hypothetical protein
MNHQSLTLSVITLVLIGFGVALATPTSAEYRKVGADKRSATQAAEDQCAAESSGSSKVIAGQIIGGLIGMAVARDMFIRDCMKTRGYEWHSQVKPQQGRQGKAN